MLFLNTTCIVVEQEVNIFPALEINVFIVEKRPVEVILLEYYIEQLTI